jgi:hypothetical protein
VSSQLLTLLEQKQQRDDWRVKLILEAIETGKPVLYGVWAPTGQNIYLTVEPKA